MRRNLISARSKPATHQRRRKVLVTIYAYKDPKTNRLKTVSPEIRPLLRELGFVEYPVETEWSVPAGPRAT
jgi:hypothetical protein